MEESLNIEGMIALFDDPLYIKYNNIIKNTNIITINDNKLIIDNYEITLPKIVNIFNRRTEIESIRRQHILNLYELQQKMINSEKPQIYKENYNNIINNIHALDEEYEILKAYYIKINQLYYDIKYDDLNHEMSTIKTSMNNLYESIIDNNFVQKSITKKYIKKYNSAFDKYNEIKQFKNSYRIDYYILELPKFKTHNKTESKNIQEKIIVKKSKLPKLSSDQKQKITENIKNMLKDKVKFSNKAECTSKAKSKEYFMSKDEILKLIDDNPEIKITMPSNYKSWNKEVLCEYLGYDK
jgi:hypothetical protein